MKIPPKYTPLASYALLILAGLVALASCGPTPLSHPEDAIPPDQGLVHIRLPQKENRSLNEDQTQGFTDYYEVIFKDVNSLNYYAGTGRTGDTVTLQVPGNTTYEILILGGYESQNRHILLGSVFANQLDGEQAKYVDAAAGIWIDGGSRTRLSFTLDPLLLEPTKDYTVAFSGAALDADGKPERINRRLAYMADTVNPLRDQPYPTELSITAALAVPSLVRAEEGGGMHFGKVQGRFEVYDPAVDRFIYYSLMEPKDALEAQGPWYPQKGSAIMLEFTLSTRAIQAVTPVDGDWKFAFEATYYGFGTSASGGTMWTIQNGLSTDLDRVGSIGGGLWVHFGNGNGFQDRELSLIGGRVEQGGTEVSGAEVRLLNGDGTVYKGLVSGFEGRYSFEEVTPGTYMVEVYWFEGSSGALYCKRQEVVVAGEALTVDLDLERGYRVSYTLNGGSGTAPESLNVISGTEITLPGWRGMSAPAGSGDAFLCWEDDVGTYQSGRKYRVNGDVRFKARWGVFRSVAEVQAYLDGCTNGEGDTDANPIPIPVSIDLSSQWAALLGVLGSKNKYVALNLSASTLGSGTVEFNPGSAGTGEGKIRSLTLPEEAESIGGSFSKFTVLEAIGGENILSIGASAFSGRTNLQTVDFPKAETVDNNAFQGCTGLKTVSLPKAETVGNNAFQGCTGLKTVSLPKAETIGKSAFQGCTGLRTVDLPAVTTIQDSAFNNCNTLRTVSLPELKTIEYRYSFANCTNLRTIDLPKAETIGYGAFQNCTSLSAVSLPAAITISDWAFNVCSQLRWVSLPAAASITYGAFQNCPISSITIKGNCNILDPDGAYNTIRDAFRGYYNGKGRVAGLYTFGPLGWTGPF